MRPKAPKTIFLSYSRANQYLAERFYYDLHRVGMNVWWDRRDINFGTEWKKSIDRGVKSCSEFYCLWSPEADQSRYVQHEVRRAIALEKKIHVFHVCGNGHPHLKKEFGKKQSFELSKSYWNGLGDFFSFLKVTCPKSTAQLVSDSMLASEAKSELEPPGRKKRLLPARKWQVGGRQFLCLPYLPKAYSTSWIVADEQAALNQTGPFHVVLQFAGNRGDDVVRDVLTHLNASGEKSPQVLYLEGPRDGNEKAGTDTVYRIPDDKTQIWKDCVDLVATAVNDLGRKREINFFLNAPSALTLPVGEKLRGLSPYKVFNLDRSSSSSVYNLVYEGPKP